MPNSANLLNNAELVGQKAVGLSYLPKKWCPPYVVINTKAYVQWKAAPGSERKDFAKSLGTNISRLARAWESEFPRGIILRSSAVAESLRERGRLESRPLPADFSAEKIGDALDAIFQDAERQLQGENLAVIVQPLVPGNSGHLSNERRVSKTRNQWMWEQEGTLFYSDRFNSQRSFPPDEDKPLRAENAEQRIKRFRSIGRWCTDLKMGPAHVEWSWCDSVLWILQLDFEDESPDDGIDPRAFIRELDGTPSEPSQQGGPLQEADFSSILTGWNKLDNVRDLAALRSNPFPRLFWISGEAFRNRDIKRIELEREIGRVTHGRAVCRTDCNSENVEKLNLPRTDSVSPTEAVEFIYETLEILEYKGAEPNKICFIVHKFIPAQSAAWALAFPTSQIVRVDSLWGVPDGLQYLPHDSFDFDIRKGEISSERLRYKPAYIQEKEDGSWNEVKVLKRLGRTRSLTRYDVAEVANLTKKLADSYGKPVQVMWFCKIPETVGIGRNLPWFYIDASGYKRPKYGKISPQRPKKKIRSEEDLINVSSVDGKNIVLVLEPEVDLIRRDEKFLCKVINLAKDMKISVELHGSTLCHAYYLLERSGITVVPSDEPKYARTRGRRVFGKLVRDSIPDRITQHGERVSLARIERSEARAALLVKLMEEAQELKLAESPDDVKAELADVHEVVRALCAATGVDWEEVEAIAEKKREKRGSFRENVVLLETSWPTGADQEEEGARKISLKDLARNIVVGDKAEISYASLFAPGTETTLRTRKGTILKFSLNERGLCVEEKNEDIYSVEQYEFKY